MHVDKEHCVGCGRCVGACNFDAIDFEDPNSNQMLNYRIAEDAKAAHDAGMNAHLSKPLDFNKLKNILARIKKSGSVSL